MRSLKSYRTSKSCGAKKFLGTERAVGLLSWLEEMEYVLYISKCPAESQVEFVSSQPWENLKKLLREKYCPDNAIKKFKEEFYNHVMIGADVDKYITRFHELARLVPHTVTPKSIDRYIRGLAPAIRRTMETSPC
ncbi:putative reverse transcriptase domain-containing protein [Tanacetum coccineum]